MREIKFRCWYDNRMYKVVDIDFDYEKISLFGLFGADIINFKDGNLMQYTGLKDGKLMQYTGLHDKNGKEIYEGDIVKHNGFYEGDCYYNAGCGQVLWDDEDTGFYLTAKDTSFISLFDLTRNLDGEVIGNIYDNPELLEV